MLPHTRLSHVLVDRVFFSVPETLNQGALPTTTVTTTAPRTGENAIPSAMPAVHKAFSASPFGGQMTTGLEPRP